METRYASADASAHPRTPQRRRLSPLALSGPQSSRLLNSPPTVPAVSEPAPITSNAFAASHTVPPNSNSPTGRPTEPFSRPQLPGVGSPSRRQAPNPDMAPLSALYDISKLHAANCKIIGGKVYNDKGHTICGVLNQHDRPCQRIGRCPFHYYSRPVSADNICNGTVDANGTAIPEMSHISMATNGLSPTSGAAGSTASGAVLSQMAMVPPKKVQYKHGWTKEEHYLFLKGLERHGKGAWKQIASEVRTRTPTQVQSHAQKYFLRRKQHNKNKRSIHDLTMESAEMREIDKSLNMGSSPDSLFRRQTAAALGEDYMNMNAFSPTMGAAEGPTNVLGGFYPPREDDRSNVFSSLGYRNSTGRESQGLPWNQSYVSTLQRPHGIARAGEGWQPKTHFPGSSLNLHQNSLPHQRDGPDELGRPGSTYRRISRPSDFTNPSSSFDRGVLRTQPLQGSRSGQGAMPPIDAQPSLSNLGSTNNRILNPMGTVSDAVSSLPVAYGSGTQFQPGLGPSVGSSGLQSTSMMPGFSQPTRMYAQDDASRGSTFPALGTETPNPNVYLNGDVGLTTGTDAVSNILHAYKAGGQKPQTRNQGELNSDQARSKQYTPPWPGGNQNPIFNKGGVIGSDIPSNPTSVPLSHRASDMLAGTSSVIGDQNIGSTFDNIGSNTAAPLQPSFLGGVDLAETSAVDLQASREPGSTNRDNATLSYPMGSSPMSGTNNTIHANSRVPGHPNQTQRVDSQTETGWKRSE